MVLVYDCLEPFHSVRHVYIMFFQLVYRVADTFGTLPVTVDESIN